MLVSLAALMLVSAAARAHAQPPVDTAAYEALVLDAIGEFSAGRFAEARVLFRTAHAQSPNARTLRGIGMSSFELSDYVEAYVSLSAALVDTRRPLTDEMRAQTEALRARALAFVGRIVITSDRADARVLIDGTPPTVAEGAILVNEGTHTISITANGFTERHETVRVEAGRTLRMAVSFTQTAAPVPERRGLFGLRSAEPEVAVAPPRELPPLPMPEAFGAAFPARTTEDSPVEGEAWRYSGGRFTLGLTASIGAEHAFDTFSPDRFVDVNGRSEYLYCDTCANTSARLGLGIEPRVRLSHRAELAFGVDGGVRLNDLTLRLYYATSIPAESQRAWWVRITPALRIAPGTSRFVLGLGVRIAFAYQSFTFATMPEFTYDHRRKTIEGLLELGGRLGRQRDLLVLLRQSYGALGLSVELALVLPIARGGR